ncbi:MAG: hypothetical protein JHD05_06425 [Thermoleophilia bacterium]|nr:hypothetical protein [Thermoleophilia bacterium]MBJ7334237.1 hypothetical protein [Thermoleophilia bacterium]
MRIRVIVSLAAIVGLLLCVGSASAGTLAQSLARVSVPADDRSADLKTLADARTLATDLGGSRAVALKAIIKSATQIGNQAAFSPALARIVFLELQSNVTYLASHALPSTGTRIRIDGVVYESYRGQGLRIQPLGTYFAILEPGQGIVSEGGVGAAMTSAQKIVLTDGESYTLPYLFSWMGHAPNWQSAMAEGVAASAGLSAWNRTGDDTFLDSAMRFGNGALGDAITVENNGLWFPLYVFAPSYRVLNGHMQAVLSMNDLADATGDDGFADAFSRGVATTKAVLPTYDTGGWGRYAIGEDAPVKYMTLMATQLKELGQITGDPAFTDMGNKFTADLTTPPVIAGPAEPPKPLKLKKFKRQKPFIKLRIVRDKPVTLTLRFFTKQGKSAGVGPVVISVSSGASRIKLNLPTKAGRYSIRADAKDWAGNKVKNVVLTTLILKK